MLLIAPHHKMCLNKLKIQAKPSDNTPTAKMICTRASDTPTSKRQRSVTTDEEIKKHFCALNRERIVVDSKDALTTATLPADMMLTPLLPRISILTASVELPPQIDFRVEMHPHQRHKILQVYSDISNAQNLIFSELGLATNDACDMAITAEWILKMALEYRMMTETVHSGLYLYFTYMAHVQRHYGGSETDDDCGLFELYRNRLMMTMKHDDRSRVWYAISATFCRKLARNENKLLIAATCLCMAAKMEESHFDMMIKPSQIIRDMKMIGHPIGQHTEFDFITVERDILEQLKWRLFRVHTPIPFLRMLFVCYDTSTKSQFEASKLLTVCLSSHKYVSMCPSKLAALCLVTAMHTNEGLYASASAIVAISNLINLSVEELLQHSESIQFLRESTNIGNNTYSKVTALAGADTAATDLKSRPLFASVLGCSREAPVLLF